jgi:replicative DNA helicase
MAHDPSIIPMVKSKIDSVDFFVFPEHKEIYQSCINVAEQHGVINISVISIKTDLQARGVYESIGGQQYLIEVLEAVTGAATWEYHVKTLRDQHVKRCMIKCASETMSLATSDESTDVAVEKALQLFRGLLANEIGDEGVSDLRDIYKSLDAFDDENFIPCGFYGIDNIIKGFVTSEVIIIGARSGMGKTILAVNIALDMALRGIPIMFFSLEMKEVALHKRLICNKSGYSEEEVKGRDEMRREAMDDFGKHMSDLEPIPFHIDHNVRLSPSLLRAKLMKYKAKYGIKIAFIDYLTIMKADKEFSSKYHQVSETVDEIKRIAREEDVAIVLVCQLNREADKRPDKRPHLSDLRDSGSVEQNADVVMLIYREDYYTHENTGEAEIILAKVREKSPCTVRMRFDGEHKRFKDRL